MTDIRDVIVTKEILDLDIRAGDVVTLRAVPFELPRILGDEKRKQYPVAFELVEHTHGSGQA